MDTRRKIELGKSVDGLLGGLHDVEKTVMSPPLELLTGLFVDVRSAQDRPPVDGGRKRERPTNVDTSALGGLDNLPGTLVQELVVVSLEANTNLVV